MIQIRQLEKIYRSRLGGGCKALSNISLDFPDKGMVFILGRSGSGKSTLLNLLGGLDKATSGEIIYKGQSIKKFKDRDYDSYRNNVGFVFQDFNLLDNMTVRENLALALELKSGNVNDEEIIRALEVADIAELINRYPNELSGGQKQRAALARAIVLSLQMNLREILIRKMAR
jgi:ABC-type lipoprotein export system ATPase subunit